VDAITSLALASLEEDQYGTVSKDIPQIARVFADTIKGIDGFLQALPLHWTDVESKGTGNGKQSKECDMVIAHLKVGLKKLLEAFGTYAMNLGLRNGEMRELRLIAGLDA
jgi:nucleoporin NDC1